MRYITHGKRRTFAPCLSGRDHLLFVESTQTYQMSALILAFLVIVVESIQTTKTNVSFSWRTLKDRFHRMHKQIVLLCVNGWYLQEIWLFRSNGSSNGYALERAHDIPNPSSFVFFRCRLSLLREGLEERRSQGLIFNWRYQRSSGLPLFSLKMIICKSNSLIYFDRKIEFNYYYFLVKF